jgi:hypothetical protein
MLLGWLVHLQRKTSRTGRRKPQKRGSRRLEFQLLESRQVLSGAPLGFATFMHRAADPTDGLIPASTPGPTGYSPQQIRAAYGVDKVPYDGSGMTIAIVDAYDDPTIASDLVQFDRTFGLPDPVFTKVNQSGGSSMPIADTGWASEIALDVEWAHAIAPKANILLVEASSSSFSNLFAAVNYARQASNVVAVSMSWGGGEFSTERNYDGYFTTPAGHAGVSFLASSGDSGAPGIYPAVSPNVISVGGTSLYLSGGAYSTESGWSGSGGGISTYEPQPAYQNGIVTQSTTARTAPDVAYDSDPNTGYPVYDSYNNGTTAPWGQWGGTSAAAPQWAALTALVDQGLNAKGKGTLDGATKLLPALYQSSTSDFHDVVSGTSTGTPRFTAAAGYDLVTGRGTPIANLLINDLVGTTNAASQFSVSTPGNSVAGTAFDLTVTPLTASGQTPANSYVGTITFSSSDSLAGLPANYTFQAGETSHTFTGVVLKTAGNQSITVTDTISSTVKGSASVSVSAAVADHLVFAQQPSNTVVNTAISPAVSVRVVDQYNNLVTTDSTDQVTLTLGANPGLAVLGGTTTLTVSGGVALFNNLTLSAIGSGYTLIASSGTGVSLAGAISNPFDIVAVPAATVIAGFESGNLSGWKVHGTGSSSASVAVTTIARHDGTYGLQDYGGNDWIYRNDSSVTVQRGDTVSTWVEFASSADGRAYFGFGAKSNGTLSLVAAPSTNQLIIQDNGSWGNVDLAAVSQTWLANHWYRLEVSLGTSASIVGRLYDSDGTTLLKSVSVSTNAFSSGGIAFRAIGNTKYWDTVTVIHGGTALNANGMSGQTISGSSDNNDDQKSAPCAAAAPTSQAVAPAVGSKPGLFAKSAAFTREDLDSYFASLGTFGGKIKPARR